MSKKISIANSMPLTIGVIAGAIVASYMLAALIAEAKIGRPSSTAAIGFLFVPIYSGIVALIGLVVGFIVRLVLKNKGGKDKVPARNFFVKSAVVLIVTCGFASAIGVKEVVDYENVNTPRILSSNGAFIRNDLLREDAPSVEVHGKLIWDFENGSTDSLSWNGVEVTANVNHSTQLTLHGKNDLTWHYNFRLYSYLTEIEAIKLQSTSGPDEYLVVLARLRATSFRSMLLIYDANGNLAHEELLKRCGRKQYMGLVYGIGGESLVVDICSPFSIQVKRPNKARNADGFAAGSL